MGRVEKDFTYSSTLKLLPDQLQCPGHTNGIPVSIPIQLANVHFSKGLNPVNSLPHRHFLSLWQRPPNEPYLPSSFHLSHPYDS